MTTLHSQSSSRRPTPAVELITVREASARSGRPVRSITWSCASEYAARGMAEKRDGVWMINPYADTAFMTLTLSGRQRVDGDVRSYSARKRSSAAIRRQILADLEASVADAMSHGASRGATPASRGATPASRVDAIDSFVADARRHHRYPIRFSRTTLYSWQKKAATAPATGLIDHRGLHRSGDRDEPPPDARAEFERRYLDLRKPSLTTVHHEVSLLARENGWWWFGSVGSLRRWVRSTYPEAQLTLGREGKTAYNRKHAPYVQCDPDSFSPGECYVGDHHQFREWCTHNGKLIRPWLSAWADMATGLFVGWAIVAEPNQPAILAAARDAVLRRDMHVPNRWLVDNGKDYRGYALSGTARKRVFQSKGWLDEAEVRGLFALLGGEVHFSLPYNPNSKPVERSFQTIEEQFGRRLPTYTGRDPDDRPEDLKRVLAQPELIPNMEVLAAQWSDYIESVFNTALHPIRNRPRLALFESRPVKRPLAHPDVLDLLMVLWSQPVKVSRNGVRYRGLLYGQFQPELLALQGRDVLVSYDPADISSVGVWDLEHRFVCRARQNQLHNRAVADEHLRSAMRTKSQVRKAMRVVQGHRYAAYADTPTLTIAAQAAANRTKTKQHAVAQATGTDGADPVIIQPVMTRLDDQTRSAGAPPFAQQRVGDAAGPPPRPGVGDGSVIQRSTPRKPASDLKPNIIRGRRRGNTFLPIAAPVVQRGSVSDKLREAAWPERDPDAGRDRVEGPEPDTPAPQWCRTVQNDDDRPDTASASG